jgi:hypothetical protein
MTAMHRDRRANLLCYSSITRRTRQPLVGRSLKAERSLMGNMAPRISPDAIQTHAIAAIVPFGRYDDRSGPALSNCRDHQDAAPREGAKQTRAPLFPRVRPSFFRSAARVPGRIVPRTIQPRTLPEEVKFGSNRATRKMHYLKSDICDVPIRQLKDTMMKNI